MARARDQARWRRRQHERGRRPVAGYVPRGLWLALHRRAAARAAQPLAARAHPILRAQAGIAPVTRQSGHRGVLMRAGCNRRLRQAVYHWARVSVQRDPHSRAHYAALRQQGHRHPRAQRGVADRLLALLIAMLKAGTLYDAARPRRREIAA